MRIVPDGCLPTCFRRKEITLEHTPMNGLMRQASFILIGEKQQNRKITRPFTMQYSKKPPPSLLFIFGGSGDLNQRKLSPALFNLFIDGRMPDKFSIFGLGRTEYSDEKFRQHLFEGIKEFSRRKNNDQAEWNEFSKNLFYLKLDASDAASYSAIGDCIAKKEKEFKAKPIVIFYMAVAPQLVPVIAN